MKINCRLLYVVIGSFFFTACYEEPNIANDNLLIELSDTIVEANGIDAVRVNLLISKEQTIDVNSRKIVVTTSLGFFGADKASKSVTVTTDATGSAAVYLRSEGAGEAVIEASVGTNVYRYAEVTFIPKVTTLMILPETTTVEADGITTSRIEVSIVKAPKISTQSISLKTTLGSFSNGEENIDLTTDEMGKAFTYIKSDSQGTAVLAASFGSEVSVQTEITFVPEVVTLALNAETGVLEADGVATTKIELSIIKAADRSGRKVSLTTSLGSFSDGRKALEVTTNEEGKSIVFLKSDTAGKALLIASLGSDASAQTEVTFTPKVVTISVISDRETLEADGASLSRIEVVITKATTVSNRKISVATNLGELSGGGKTEELLTDSDGKAITFVKSGDAGNAILTVALADEALVRKEITFIDAPPERISLSTEVLEATSGAGSLLTITVLLRRTLGRPSTGFVPIVEAFDSNGVSIGSFTAMSASDSEGKCQVKFAVPDQTFSGPVTFKGSLQLTDELLQSDTYGPVYFKPAG